jgi:hypothetical protein
VCVCVCVCVVYMLMFYSRINHVDVCAIFCRYVGLSRVGAWENFRIAPLHPGFTLEHFAHFKEHPAYTLWKNSLDEDGFFLADDCRRLSALTKTEPKPKRKAPAKRTVSASPAKPVSLKARKPVTPRKQVAKTAAPPPSSASPGKPVGKLPVPPHKPACKPPAPPAAPPPLVAPLNERLAFFCCSLRS